jgi:hypothetical protein
VDTLAFFANIGSLVGLAATLWTAWRAYQSKRYYLLVGRVPEQLEVLRAHAGDLARANLDPRRPRSDVLNALKQVRVTLESIADNLGRNERKAFARLARRIRQVEQADSLDADTVSRVWAESQALASRIDETIQNRKFAR